MTELEKFLREMGLAAPTPKPAQVERQFKGVWYRDGDIPH
jgi:hypothetical protein